MSGSDNESRQRRQRAKFTPVNQGSGEGERQRAKFTPVNQGDSGEERQRAKFTLVGTNKEQGARQETARTQAEIDRDVSFFIAFYCDFGEMVGDVLALLPQYSSRWKAEAPHKSNK